MSGEQFQWNGHPVGITFPVTSPARGGPDTAGMREAIEEVLAERLQVRNGMGERAVGRLADALLPVVQRLAVEKAAEELRAAADELVKDGRPDLTTIDEVQAVNDAAGWLDARADALAAAAQPTDGR